MLVFLDHLLLFLHIIIILFFFMGAFIKPLQKVHFMLVLFIAFSWFILGIFYGFGYCFLTEWHWQVKYKLGEYDLPYSYIQYLLNEYLGIYLSNMTVDILTLSSFIIIGIKSIITAIKSKLFTRNKG